LKQLREYVEVFENATPAEHCMIASTLIERVTVYPSYELDIQFRVGIDSLAQLPEEETGEVDK